MGYLIGERWEWEIGMGDWLSDGKGDGRWEDVGMGDERMWGFEIGVGDIREFLPEIFNKTKIL